MLNLRLSSPVTVFLNLTNSCNLRCIYCSADSGVPSDDDLSAGELHRLIDDFIDLKVCKVIVTGGEPFVRTDALDLLEHMAEGRITLSVLTNGTMIRPPLARCLSELGIGDLSVSLDGADEAVNDRTRGEGSFARSMDGVRCLLDNGVRPTILVTVTTANYDHIEEMADALRELGVNAVAFNLMAFQGRGGDCSGLGLAPEQIRVYAAGLRRAKVRHSSFVREDFLHWVELPRQLAKRRRKSPDSSTERPHLLPCDAAKASCAIGSDGTVYPCNRFTLYPCGNLRESSLADIWRGERMERLRTLSEKPTSASSGCSGCEYTGVCAGGCRALAHLATEELEGPDPTCLAVAESGLHGVSPTDRLVQLGSGGTE